MKKKHVMVKMSKNPKNISHNQQLSAECSTLRGVCTKTRVEDPSGNQIASRETDREGGLPWSAWALRAPLLPTLTLTIAIAATSSSAFEKASWSSSGDFSLTGSFTSSTSWSRPTNEWSAFDGFELSRPGIAPSAAARIVIGNGSQLDRLLDLIASAEAGSKGYDTIHYSARRLPSKPPSQMTIGEIFAWIRATPGQHHAIGRYQFIPSTLAYLVEAEGIPSNAVFGPDLQKRLAFRLMVDGGYHDFAAGRMSRSRFQDRLARIWAGLPLANGRSYYAGTAGNRATISRASFDAAMASIYGS